MPQGNWLILVIMGGVFILLGVGALYWGRREERDYTDHVATRTDDMREFMVGWPFRPQVGAPKLGGLIAMIIGIIVLATGIVLYLVAPEA